MYITSRMKRIVTWFFSLLAFGFFAAGCDTDFEDQYASSQASLAALGTELTGMVSFDTVALQDAEVMVLDRADMSAAISTANTDAVGRFVLSVPGAGSYLLLVSRSSGNGMFQKDYAFELRDDEPTVDIGDIEALYYGSEPYDPEYLGISDLEYNDDDLATLKEE